MQIQALVYKNWILKKRSSLGTLFDILVPLLICYNYLSQLNLVTGDQDGGPTKFASGLISNMIIPVAFFFLVRKVISQVVAEKESGMKEYLTINGCKLLPYQVSFLASEAILAFIICALLIMVVKMFSDQEYRWGDLIIFSVSLMIFVINLIAQAILVSMLFKSQSIATQLGSLIMLIPIALTIYLKIKEIKDNLDALIQFKQNPQYDYDIWILYIFPHHPFTKVSLLAFQTDKSQVALKILGLIALQVLNIFFHMLVISLIENRGFFKKLIHQFVIRKENHQKKKSFELSDEDSEQASLTSKLTPVIKFANVSKKFGSFKAIDKLHMMLYENQIFCLMGHNGAGKTTAINLLTGQHKPSEGTVYINDGNRELDVRYDLAEIRLKIGLCQQHDIIFDNLTVEEHLKLICRLKLIKGDQSRRIQEILDTTALHKQRDTLAKTLSGGMKRRLSIAMGIVAESKILIMDEPTTGLDPIVREQVWELIKSLKTDRCILMTTQHLEEAELLADSLGLLDSGKLMARGTPDEIKKKYGVGYNLKISYPDTFLNHQIEDLKQLVLTSIPCSYPMQVSTASKNTLNFVLPFEKQQFYSELFKQLESYYSLSFKLVLTSLEEAFLNFTRIQHDQKQQPESDIEDFQIEQHFPTVKLQLKASLLKRWYTFKRDWRMWVLLFLPLIMISIFHIIALFKATKQSPQQEQTKEQQVDEEDDAYGNDFNAQLAQMLNVQKDKIIQEMIQYASELVYSIWIIFSISLCSGMFIENPVMERFLKIRYQLNVVGMKQCIYWVGTFLFDYLLYFSQVLLILSIVFTMELKAFEDEFFSFIVLMLAFGVAHLNFSYFMSFFFTDSQSALKVFSFVYVFGGFFFPFFFKQVVFIKQGCSAYHFVEALSQLIPLQTLDVGFKAIINEAHKKLFDAQEQLTKPNLEKVQQESENPLFVDRALCKPDINTIDQSISILIFTSIFYFCLVLILERFMIYYYKNPELKTYPHEHNQHKEADIVLSARDLTKVYNNKVEAVKGINFTLKEHEILGLLGPNGAGKSSTFNMITLQTQRTSGEIEIQHKDLSQCDFNKENLGITAQDNILWPTVSLREHFDIFGLVRGYPKEYIDKAFNFYHKKLELDKSHKTAGILSGGNKRKLCTALSLFVQPKILFLDESTVGLDPVARRTLLMLIKETNVATLFTSHRLDEAEFLCDRIAILIGGKILCLGTLEELKRQYANQYFILLSNPEEHKVDSLLKSRYGKDFEQVSESNNVDQNIVQHLYKVSKDKIILSELFELLILMKDEDHIIQDFSFFEASLHHVFVLINKTHDLNI